MGAPELLRAEMPLIRMVERGLVEDGYIKGTEDYRVALNYALAFYRKFGWRAA